MRPNPLRAPGRVLPLVVLFGAVSVQALEVPGPVVDTEWLSSNLGQVVVLDVRRDGQTFIRKAGGGGEVGGVQACGAKGSAGAVSGHIPGSALIEWKDLAVKQKVGDNTAADTPTNHNLLRFFAIRSPTTAGKKYTAMPIATSAPGKG